MEIQFALPINTAARARSNQLSTPVPPSPAPSVATTTSSGSKPVSYGTNRGTTHRFALDTRTRHTRRSSTRARTGCSTCKKRHVKCDETKPSCLNCMKWRGYCDGYVATSPTEGQANKKTPTAKLIQTKKAPKMVMEPPVNTVRFESEDQRSYFSEWTSLSVTFLSGGLSDTRLWTATMPQLTLEEPTLRYGAMAIGALRKAYHEEGQVIGTMLTTDNKHYLNAIIYYCEALRIQSKARPSRENLRTAMLSSLLFICFETQRANMPAALKHITHGFSMLNELAACTDRADDLVSIAPAPPTLVREILDCYKPLELQSRSFMGSYKKFFFPPGARPNEQPPSPAGSGETSAQGYAAVPDPYRESSATQSPLSSPGTPWQSTSESGAPGAQSQSALPSPQSQASPSGSSPGNSPGPPSPQRPPGIMPFTKHSPYFRPKQSNIVSLEGMPRVFQTQDEAQGYWSLLQKQMVQYIPVLTGASAQLAMPKIRDDAELDRRLAAVKQNPRIAKFVAESRYWLQRWVEAFDPLYSATARDSHRNLYPYLQAASMRIEYLILYIYTAVPRFSGLHTAKGLTPQYREINYLAEILLQARPNCGFAMDSGWTWPLFVASFGCRDPAVRAESIRILGQYPIRNALRDSRVFRAIALRNQQIEEETAAIGGDDATQWLRLRRRELVFEDFGTNIIFRSAKLNSETGLWETIEEAANFMVQHDGTLDWQRQPISETISILVGVC